MTNMYTLSVMRLSRPRLVILSAVLVSVLSAGCSEMAADIGMESSAPATIQAQVERSEPVRKTGRPAAVLSVHLRKSYENACKYGMTLTNDLPFKITNLTFRFTAYIKGGVPYDTQNKNFYELRPTESQYRELTFQGVSCSEIERIAVSDPGRCAMGKLNRFTAEAGDCRKFSDIASTSLVRIGWK